MFKIFRVVVLTSALLLIFTFWPAPAHASFGAICYITGGTLTPIRIQADDDGGVTFYIQTVKGDGRFFQMRPAGGHWEISSMHSLPTGSSLELDDSGFPIVHQE